MKIYWVGFVYLAMIIASNRVEARKWLSGGQKEAYNIISQSHRYSHFYKTGGHYNSDENVRDYYWVRKGKLLGEGKNYLISIYSISENDSSYWRVELYRCAKNNQTLIQSFNVEDGNLPPIAEGKLISLKQCGKDNFLFIMNAFFWIGAGETYSVYQFSKGKLHHILGFENFPNPEYIQGRWVSGYGHSCFLTLQQSYLSAYKLKSEYFCIINSCDQPNDTSMVSISINHRNMIIKAKNAKAVLPWRLRPYYF